MNETYARANAALRWTSVVRRLWLHAATCAVCDIPDVRTPERARRLLGRAERRLERELDAVDAAGQVSRVPDQAARQLAGRPRATRARS